MNLTVDFTLDFKSRSSTKLQASTNVVWAFPTYQYRPLESKDHIRLLFLKREDKGSHEELECQLRHEPLDKANFVALSYVWQSPARTKKMVTYDERGRLRQISLTESLWRMLMDLRSSASYVYSK